MGARRYTLLWRVSLPRLKSLAEARCAGRQSALLLHSQSKVDRMLERFRVIA
ncbi:MAG: hypothetical protein U9Q70_11700 [Chloroflexota bacterium]|nr:hypothetical protein [Chloroflexota bacterium]